jgi:ectoine hydroxylase-related dioxygenase (phytanoyl-CoA dioxygenase family)
LLVGVETFNKPARVGSGVPYHQDNAYFCQTPPDMLTIWIAMDAVTMANGPVYYVRGSQKTGMLPTKLSGVKGNSIGLAEAPAVPLEEQFCGLRVCNLA